MNEVKVVQRVFLIAVLLTLIADQLSKFLAVMFLKDQLPITLGFVEFTYSLNRGNLFGAMIGDPGLGRFTKLCMYLCLGWIGRILMREFEHKKTGALASGLVFGGAAGNFFDTLTYGGTPDMIRLLHCGPLSGWVFNIADIAVFGGMGRFIWEVMRKRKSVAPKA